MILAIGWDLILLVVKLVLWEDVTFLNSFLFFSLFLGAHCNNPQNIYIISRIFIVSNFYIISTVLLHLIFFLFLLAIFSSFGCFSRVLWANVDIFYRFCYLSYLYLCCILICFFEDFGTVGWVGGSILWVIWYDIVKNVKNRYAIV